ncbi:hypothetical protein RAH32_03005 [Paracoccus sp. WLY502]|uniref:5-carboxymethyl-2-hydroxymuconate Delta-isomerase n=1 Tax=Paracoccus yibinensis TaxID=3068891 RepID=UPI002796795F|nr:hypothetical protein [Paracoccus sp. WLY502]MDQ1899414.1 hypothetical protein [Paracoccus sp. WLY502]
MPHVIIEYSDNVEEWGDPGQITSAVHDALCNSGLLPAEAIKTRAIRHGMVRIGRDRAGLKGFATVLIRTRPGREDHVLQQISAIARDAVIERIAARPGKEFSVSVEIQMMDPVAVLQAKI